MSQFEDDNKRVCSSCFRAFDIVNGKLVDHRCPHGLPCEDGKPCPNCAMPRWAETGEGNFTLPDKIGASTCTIPDEPELVIALWFQSGREQRAYAITADKARSLADYLQTLLAATVN